MIDAHERAVTGIDWSKPSPEPRKLPHLQPGWDEIPDEHKRIPIRHPLAYYHDGKAKVKDGLNEQHAIDHLTEVAGSWQYAVEHKQAALSYLGALWLDFENQDAAA